jgi:hypothetical protein
MTGRHPLRRRKKGREDNIRTDLGETWMGGRWNWGTST